MKPPSPTDPAPANLRDQIIGLEERALRKSYYPQLQLQVEALRQAKDSLEQQAAELRHMLDELEAMRRRAEESEANYRELFDKSGEAIIVHDPLGSTIYEVNEAFTELYGYTHEEASALSIAQISSPAMDSETAGIREHIDNAMQTGTHRFEWLAQHKNGSDFWVDVTLKSATIRGEQLSLATVRDITDRKRAQAELAEVNRLLEEKVAARTQALAEANREQAVLLEHLKTTQHQLVQSEKLAALGSLVAGISHELSTPIGNCLLLTSTLAESQREFARSVENGLRKSTLQGFLLEMNSGFDSLLRNLHRAGELVNGFKDLSVDQASSRRRSFDLFQIISEIEITHAPVLRHSGSTLINRIPAGIEMDSFPGPLGQVISNLISNAICHGFEGKSDGQITINAEADDQQVRIVFADNGCGIPDENLQKIFDPFFTTKLGQGGSGLGLHIVYTLIGGILGGTIKASNIPDGGLQFEILLPRLAPNTSPANRTG